jgi:hypothetical protein
MAFRSGKWPEQKKGKRHIWLSNVESGQNKGQSVTYAFPKWNVARTKKGQSVTYGFPTWKVAKTKDKASHMAFQSGRWPEQRAKRHICLSKVEGGMKKEQSVTYGLPKLKVV